MLCASKEDDAEGIGTVRYGLGRFFSILGRLLFKASASLRRFSTTTSTSLCKMDEVASMTVSSRVMRVVVQDGLE